MEFCFGLVLGKGKGVICAERGGAVHGGEMGSWISCGGFAISGTTSLITGACAIGELISIFWLSVSMTEECLVVFRIDTRIRRFPLVLLIQKILSFKLENSHI